MRSVATREIELGCLSGRPAHPATFIISVESYFAVMEAVRCDIQHAHHGGPINIECKR